MKSYKAQRDKKRNQLDNEWPGKNVEVVGHVVRRKEHYLRRRALGMEVQGRRRRRRRRPLKREDGWIVLPMIPKRGRDCQGLRKCMTDLQGGIYIIR